MESSNRKEDVIIEIGSEWMRVGLVGDKTPRKAFRPKSITKILYNKQKNRDPIENQMIMEELLCSIFFVFLNSTCKGKTVIILEKVFTQRIILELMATVLFKKLKIEKLEMCLSCVTPLYLTAKYSGIVISGGSSCTQIMPVFEGFPLFPQYQFINVGTNRVNRTVRDELYLMNPDIDKEIIKNLSEEQIGDIKNNYGSIPSESKDIVIPVKRNKLKFNTAKISFDVLFGDYENEEPNIAYGFLQTLNRVPVDCLDKICSNVVFAGGMWRVKGMQNAFKKNLIKLLDTKICQTEEHMFSRLVNMNIKSKLSTFMLYQNLDFVSWGFNPSEVAWIGCSIGASVKNIQNMCLRKSEFEQNESQFTEKIFQTYFMSG